MRLCLGLLLRLLSLGVGHAAPLSQAEREARAVFIFSGTVLSIWGEILTVPMGKDRSVTATILVDHVEKKPSESDEIAKGDTLPVHITIAASL